MTRTNLPQPPANPNPNSSNTSTSTPTPTPTPTAPPTPTMHRVPTSSSSSPSPPSPQLLIKGGHGGSMCIRKNQTFRVIDVHGRQVVDFLAFALPSLHEKLSMSYTRYQHRGATPAAGDFLYTNDNKPMLRIRCDTVKVHDMTFMSCNPGFYDEMGLRGHRSCAENLAGALEEAGHGDKVGRLELPDPWNLFQNTPNYSLKGINTSRAGDFIELEALMDCLIVASACPFDRDGFNGGKATDIALVIVG